ncbi:hypothetical protein [Streptomyces goshikiensis]|uniref:hypothetical protein n=1 Tax=Streptomyces goshikiensis TaxID=1942 RepID=UPI0036956960
MARYDQAAMVAALKFAHSNLDGLKVKELVDKKGIDGYISHCAMLAATTGVASGMGGPVTMVLGVPADMANTIAQQFRVTMGVIYHKTGSYSLSFEEFMKIVAVSLGVEVGTQVVVRVAAEIFKRLTAKVAGKFIPLLGGVIGGGLNYGFIMAQGKALLALDLDKLTPSA